MDRKLRFIITYGKLGETISTAYVRVYASAWSSFNSVAIMLIFSL